MNRFQSNMQQSDPERVDACTNAKATATRGLIVVSLISYPSADRRIRSGPRVIRPFSCVAWTYIACIRFEISIRLLAGSISSHCFFLFLLFNRRRQQRKSWADEPPTACCFFFTDVFTRLLTSYMNKIANWLEKWVGRNH